MQLDLRHAARAAVEKEHGPGFDVIVDAAVDACLAALPGEPRAYEHIKIEGTFKTPGEYFDTDSKANYRPLYASPQPAVSDEAFPSDATVKAMWNAHGGSQHGPHVETYTIPEVDFWRFIRALAAALAAEGRRR